MGRPSKGEHEKETEARRGPPSPPCGTILRTRRRSVHSLIHFRPDFFGNWTAQMSSQAGKIGGREHVQTYSIGPRPFRGSARPRPDAGPVAARLPAGSRPAGAAQLLPAVGQIHGGRRPGAAHRPVHAGRPGAAAVAVAAAERRDFPQGARRLRRPGPADPGGLREPAAAGAGQRLARLCLPGREETIRSFGGVDAAGARRGRADPRRPVSRGAADAGGVARPARRAVHAVRPARLVLRRVAAATARGSACRSPGATARASRPTSSPRRRGRWAPPGCDQEYECSSPPWKAWFIPISGRGA